MKILIIGDSITDMGRNRDTDQLVFTYGAGYPFVIASKLSERNPLQYQVINKGISGDRIVDLYARMTRDVLCFKPDLISILIGINDLWHGINPDWPNNGIDIETYEKVYRMYIEDIKKYLPNVKFIIMEPFLLHGTGTDVIWNKFVKAYDYASVARKIASDYNIPFVELQKPLDEAALKYGAKTYLFDGVHPDLPGATLIANEWMKVFDKYYKED